MFTVILLMQFITIFTGLVCMIRQRPVILCIIFMLTCLATINQQLVIPYCKNVWKLPRNICYNIFSLIDIPCWFMIFRIIFRQHKFIRFIIILSGLATLLFTLTEIFITGTIRDFHRYSFMCFNVCMLAFSMLYISLQSQQPRHSFLKDPAFWLCGAALFFNSIFFINLASLAGPEYWSHPKPLRTFYILQSLAILLNLSCICIAFLTNYYRCRPITRQCS